MKLQPGKYPWLIGNSEGSLKVDIDENVHAVRLFFWIHPGIETGVEELHCKKKVTDHCYDTEMA